MGAAASAERAPLRTRIVRLGQGGQFLIVDGRAHARPQMIIQRNGTLLATNGTTNGLHVNAGSSLAILAALAASEIRLQAALERTAAARRLAEANEPKGPPPAAAVTLAALPVQPARADELSEENSACCVCLETLRPGNAVAKLPCGHLYHPHCVTAWLARHCTCPNCRYELPTDDIVFEEGRAERMSKRRPRCRMRDLFRKSMSELRALLPSGSSDVGVLEKRDLVRRVVEAGVIDVVDAGSEDDVVVVEDLGDWSVKRLKALMDDLGVAGEACVEKDDLVDALFASGRVVASPTKPDVSSSEISPVDRLQAERRATVQQQVTAARERVGAGVSLESPDTEVDVA